jgi:hypothetical protein
MIVEWYDVESIAGVDSILVWGASEHRRLTDSELDELILYFEDNDLTDKAFIVGELRAERMWRDKLEND